MATPAQMRHLAAVIKAENEIRKATDAALRSWLPLVEAAVLTGTTVEPARAERTREDWDQRVQEILTVILLLWHKRFLAAGAGNPSVQESNRFAAEVRRRLGSMADTVFKRVTRVVDEGLRAGADEGVLRALVMDELAPLNANPAAVHIKTSSDATARTFGVSTYNAGAEAGHLAVTAATGATFDKRWDGILDNRIRPSHRLADGQVVPAGQPFLVGGYRAQYPGDAVLPAHEALGCRCIAEFAPTGHFGPITAAGGAAMTTPDRDPDELPNGWRGPMAPLDVETGDRRILATPPGGLRTGQYPMSFTRRHVSEGDDVPIGTIDLAWIGEDGMLWGEGRLDLGSEDGRDVSRMLHERLNNGTSITPDEVTAEMRYFDAEGREYSYEELDEIYLAGNGFPEGLREVFCMVDWRLRNLSFVSIGAYDEARIQPVYGYVPPAPEPDYSAHSMVALRPADPAALAIEGGSRPASLHVTLAYLGDQPLCEVGQGAGNAAIANVALAMRNRRVKARVAGYGVLGSAEPPATVLFLNGVSLGDAHRAAMEVLGEHSELFPAPHEPFIAHMTVGYGLDLAAVAHLVGTEFELAGVTFDHQNVQTGHSFELEPTEAVVAGIGGQKFSRASFERKATGPTAMTVDPETGAIYGHVRLHGTCYQYGGGYGDGGYCVQPPESACDYAKFHVHGARVEDGAIMAVGAITFGEGHESKGSLVASREHLTHVGTIAAKVRATTDEFGVWICGEVVDAYRDKADDLLLSPLSGHWEPDADNGNYLEMIGAHIVVTPGYAVRRIVATFGDAGETTSVSILAPRRPRTADGTDAPILASALGRAARIELAKQRAGMTARERIARATASVGVDS